MKKEPAKIFEKKKIRFLSVSFAAVFCIAGCGGIISKRSRPAEFTGQIEAVCPDFYRPVTEDITEAFSPDSAEQPLIRPDACLISEDERKQLETEALSAAETVGGIYRNAGIKEVSDLFSGVYELTAEQQNQVVEELGKSGLVSVGETINMQNYEAVEAFYDEYLEGRDAMVTVFDVQGNGMIGAVTLIHRKGELQTFCVGVRWEEGGIPEIESTSINDVAEIRLTEKGYLIYAYETVVAHGSLREYWRVKPLSGKCRELTETYITGLSYVNYRMLVTDWDGSSVEKILEPRMFADIYRICTGEILRTENRRIPAEQYETIMTACFPVSAGQLRAYCGYDADSDSYPFEMMNAVPHPPFGEVIDYTEHEDGTVTLIVDGVWPDYNSDCAFTNRILVQPFADGTFRYLSNSIEQKELEIPGRNGTGQTSSEGKKNRDQSQRQEGGYRKLTAEQGPEKERKTITTPADMAIGQLSETERWAKGYALPISGQERKEAETDCKNVMDMLRHIYMQADKGEASNIVLSDDAILEMRDRAGETGCPVYTAVFYSDMENHEKMEEFLQACADGKKGSLVTYVIRRSGGIGRIKYLFDGTAMYALNANAVWNEKAASGTDITDISQTRIREWRYTGKGWFCYELCVPEYPDVTEAVNGSRLVRVRPMTGEQRELSEKCVLGLGYQGNNLLCSNWDAEHLDRLDYNGMYEYLYAIKYGKKFVPDADSADGIPGAEFESLIMEYLPVTAEQIRAYAVTNEKNNEKNHMKNDRKSNAEDCETDEGEERTYAWVGLGCGNYAPTFFGTSLPEVTAVSHNADGTVTLTVDAVCGMILCDDAVITHMVTVKFDDAGSFRYLGNEFLNNGIRYIPDYQYRISELEKSR